MVTFDLRKAEGEIISCKRVKNSGSCEEHLSKCVWARWNPSWGKCWHRTWEPLRLTFVQKYGGKNASQARRDVPVACQPLFRHSCCSKQAHNQHRRRLALQARVSEAHPEVTCDCVPSKGSPETRDAWGDDFMDSPILCRCTNLHCRNLV